MRSSRPSIKIVCSAAMLLCALGQATSIAAEDQKAVVEKIKAHNQAATSAYGASDFAEMKNKVHEALTLGAENGLGKNKVIAQSYVLLGVLQVDGLKDTDAGVRSFARALDISPAVQVPNGMATKAVKAAFKRAEDVDPGSLGEPEAVEAPKSQKAKKEKEKEKERDDSAAKAAEQDKQEKQKAAASSAADKKQAEASSAADKKQAEANSKQAEADRKEKEKRLADQAKAKASEGQAEKDKQVADNKAKLALVEKDKADKDKQLADSKARITLLEKDKADRDKWLADTKAKLALLEKDKADKDKQLADDKTRLAQLEKDKADRDKWLAATKDSEKKERDAREKLEKTVQEAALHDKEEKREREKLAAGPDLPSHISEPITCTIPDEIPPATDLFVHCVPQPALGAKAIALYYRPAGAVVYDAVTMDRTKKGWYVALIPGNKIGGKVLHYYLEARDGRQSVVASNGKSSSPNVAMVKPGSGGRRGKSK